MRMFVICYVICMRRVSFETDPTEFIMLLLRMRAVKHALKGLLAGCDL
jgi:hypothetical protein